MTLLLSSKCLNFRPYSSIWQNFKINIELCNSAISHLLRNLPKLFLQCTLFIILQYLRAGRSWQRVCKLCILLLSSRSCLVAAGSWGRLVSSPPEQSTLLSSKHLQASGHTCTQASPILNDFVIKMKGNGARFFPSICQFKFKKIILKN